MADLPPALGAAALSAPEFSGAVVPLHELDRRYARWALDQLGGKRMATAEELEIDRKTLAKLLEEELKP